MYNKNESAINPFFTFEQSNSVDFLNSREIKVRVRDPLNEK